MEKVETPQHRPFHWCDTKPFAVCVKVDEKWDYNRICQQKFRCESDCTGESFPHDHCNMAGDFTFVKLLDVAEGLTYLHRKYVVHADLKGVGTCSDSLQVTLITLGPAQHSC